MNDNAYSQLPYHTPGCVLPSPLAMLGGGYVCLGLENRSARLRCLDIGCGTGDSILRLAHNHPDIDFVGIDLSNEQIRIATEEAERAGLHNLRFACQNFLDLPTEETFDVVYCYGVLSYCPPEFVKTLLRKISAVLAVDGIALVSYNIYPGWHYKGVLRDIMMQENDRAQSPAQQVQTAKSFARFYVQGLPPNSIYRFLIQQLYQEIESLADTYLFHEYLEVENHPYHFRDFSQMCEESGLRFASEFPFAQSQLCELSFPKHLLSYLRKCETQGRTKLEEGIDLALWRSFRRSILLHRDAVTSDAMVGEEISRLRSCRFRLGMLSFTAQQSVADIHPNHTLDVVAPYGAKRTFETPYEIALLFLLRNELDYETLRDALQNVPAVIAIGGITEEVFLQCLKKMMLHGFIIPMLNK